MLPSAAKSPIHDLKDSEIETLSSNLVDRMLRTLLLATATNEPFKPQSTSQRNKLKQVIGNDKIIVTKPMIYRHTRTDI